MIANGGIGVCCKIVKEHVAGCFGFLSGCSLLVGKFIQGKNNGGVATAGIVEEKTGELLDALDTGFVKEGGKVSIGQLEFLTVDRSSPAMRGVLRCNGCRMV